MATPSWPWALLAKVTPHWCVVGLYTRMLMPSMWPADPSSSSSPTLALPFHQGRTIDVPSYSTQVLEPVSGCRRCDRWHFQAPNSKSKSCGPPSVGGTGLAGWPSDGAASSKPQATSAPPRVLVKDFTVLRPRSEDDKAVCLVDRRPAYEKARPGDYRSQPKGEPGQRLPADRRARRHGRQVEADHHLLASRGAAALRGL